MLFNFQSNKLHKHLLVGGALCAATLGFFGCKDGYNLDDEQPTGLNTIYGYMVDQGNYKNFLQLIDDLGEKETLSKTGSKTLFIADDDAFNAFYHNNQWGVTSYDQLTLAQKKIILRSSMIDNPYPISMLSSVRGPIEGECMRRTASLQVYDSVDVIRTDDPRLPNTVYWTNLAQTHDTIVLFRDGSGASPMIHFMPRFLEQNMITGDDVDRLYNLPVGTHKSDDAFVNACKVIEANIFCKNGFLHKVDKVMLPLENMAEVIRTKSQLSQYSELLERFCGPIYDYDLTERYNEIYGTHVDSVYQKSYFADRGSASTGTTNTQRIQDKDRNPVTDIIKYDPGWNRYQPGSILDQNRDEVMEDMGCMIVPNNVALQLWWDEGGGKPLKDNFGSWENVPNKVVRELINNNMLKSFVASVPSKFSSVLNDAAMEMGITTEDLDSVFLACNGVIYQTNKVFTPTSYSSVMFPTVVTEAMTVIYNAIQVLQFDAYLNSIVSHYSFFIPLNEGMLTYVDPVTLGQSETHIWKFVFDPNGTNLQRRVKAVVYNAVLQEDGTWLKGDSLSTVVGGGSVGSAGDSDPVYNRLREILDNIIVVHPDNELTITQGKHYYRTKGLNYIEVGGTINVAGSMTAAGGWHLDHNNPLTVNQVYTMENGHAYVVDEPLYSTVKATSDVLAENDEFSEFFAMLTESGALSTSPRAVLGWSSVSRNGNLIYSPTKSSESIGYLLNTYHYTIYAPTNAAMEEAYALGLPTLEMLDEAREIDADDSTVIYNEYGDTLLFYGDVLDSAAHLQKVMLDFIKYHIQDNSLFIDPGFESGNYESGKINVATGRSFKLTVEYADNNTQMFVKGICSARQPIVKDKMYNHMAREFWLNNTDVNKATLINTSSAVVLQAIDHPLLYKYYPEGIMGTKVNEETGEVEPYLYPLNTPQANQFIYSPNELYIPEEEEAIKKRAEIYRQNKRK